MKKKIKLTIKYLCIVLTLTVSFIKGYSQQVTTSDVPVEWTGLGFTGTNYQNWTPETSSTIIPDEEFFISRVPLQPRFTNSETQVDPSQSPDRKMMFWMPYGEKDNGYTLDGKHNTRAFPSSKFNSDNFGMWQYLDLHGNWGAGFS